jgi:Zn-dependent peptidase ImmA (M78 family)
MRQARPRIERVVLDLLKDNGIKRAPVPVEEIALNSGIDVRYEAAEDELSGALIRKQGEVVIGVNSAHHPNRQRFTIAHEIGHFLLHKGIKLHVDEDFRINLRDGQRNWEEMEANFFAAELLMPSAFVMRNAGRLHNLGEDDIRQLARRYQVSQRAMEIRLANLGLIDPSDEAQ